MVRLALFILGLGLLAQVSSTFIGFSHGSEPSHVETSHEWSEEPHHEEKKLEEKKKWKWLPSWPWKKKKGEQKEEHHVYEEHTSGGHYPVWKIHKYKGIEVRPIHLVEQPHQNHNYHPEVIHHYPQEHHEQEVEKEVISSFIGEGHTMDTIHKYWPAMKKDKKFLEKFKKFHIKKGNWGHHEPSHHEWSHYEPSHHEWHHGGDLHAHSSEDHPAVVATIPEVPDVTMPGLQHLPIPELPLVEDKPVFDSYGNILSVGHVKNAAPVEESHQVEGETAQQTVPQQ